MNADGCIFVLDCAAAGYMGTAQLIHETQMETSMTREDIVKLTSLSSCAG